MVRGFFTECNITGEKFLTVEKNDIYKITGDFHNIFGEEKLYMAVAGPGTVQAAVAFLSPGTFILNSANRLNKFSLGIKKGCSIEKINKHFSSQNKLIWCHKCNKHNIKDTLQT